MRSGGLIIGETRPFPFIPGGPTAPISRLELPRLGHREDPFRGSKSTFRTEHPIADDEGAASSEANKVEELAKRDPGLLQSLRRDRPVSGDGELSSAGIHFCLEPDMTAALPNHLNVGSLGPWLTSR
jgi:hypothetical protein